MEKNILLNSFWGMKEIVNNFRQMHNVHLDVACALTGTRAQMLNQLLVL